jgi:L-seryl-tRNA(Ser) seleniumtransferase
VTRSSSASRTRRPAPTSPSLAPRPPSVDHVLALVRPRLEGRLTEPEALTAHVRVVLERERVRLGSGEQPSTDIQLAGEVVAGLEAFSDPTHAAPDRVINATGVVLHTNLGRAPWPEAARAAAAHAAADYGLLELDPATGRRGRRFRLAEDHLVALTGAEDALIVGNNAAALLLAVGLAGRRGSLVVSRGELVEIGGGVRIPEVISRAGARLIEVGTTNRTRAEDFEAPLAEGRARAVLRVHPSNFTLTGFTETADLAAVARLAHEHGAIVIDDLGSGALLDTAAFGLAHEPTPAERLAAGADVVLFSGDKLVGGPQAGLIAGRHELIARLRRDPLARAMRPDKTILAGVAATLGLYRAGRVVAEIPIWRQIAVPAAALRERAQAIVAELAAAGRDEAHVVDVDSTVGGGSLPGQVLPSSGIAVRTGSPDSAARRLREGRAEGAAATDAARNRILARIEAGSIVIDLRTVDPADDPVIVRRVIADVPPGAT